MPTVSRSASVAASARQMFDLVNDIEAYPAFLEWCTGARVESATPTEVVATVKVGLAGLNQSFTTRNALEPPSGDDAGRIRMELVAGPFRRLDGSWTFRPLPDGGCEVRLDLDYELSLSPLRFALGLVFEEIARSQVGAFVKRAETLYGDG